jgi:hypothetical protein
MTDSAARHGSVWMALHDKGCQTYVMKNTDGRVLEQSVRA